MKFCFPQATAPGETPVAVTLAWAKKLVKLGLEVAVERGAGEASGYADGDYEAVVGDMAKALAGDSGMH